MPYRNLSKKEFNLIKDTSSNVCTNSDFRAIEQWKKVGNILIDLVESKDIIFDDMLQDDITEITNKVVALM